jgi:predicted glycosyltransferase
MLSIMAEFNPDVVLVDHMPLGALGELKPMLDAAARRDSRPRFLLGLRDILDSPDVIHRVWTELGAYEYLQLYDEVLIYGCRELYDAERVYALSTYARKTRYCGYVATRSDGVESFRAADEPLVLVIGGGGGDAFPLAKVFLEAFPRLSRTLRLRALILTGPNMPAADREMLVAGAAAYPIEVRCEDATPWLPQASAVVTMAGYNSLCEILRWQKKALVVPRAGPSAEQRIRSRLFAKRRLIRVIEQAQLGHEILARELPRLMSDGIPDPDNIPPLDGAEQAADAILATAPIPPQKSRSHDRVVPAGSHR